MYMYVRGPEIVSKGALAMAGRVLTSLLSPLEPNTEANSNEPFFGPPHINETCLSGTYPNSRVIFRTTRMKEHTKST